MYRPKFETGKRPLSLQNKQKNVKGHAIYVQAREESQTQNEQTFPEYQQAAVDYETKQCFENTLKEYGIVYSALNFLE